MMAVSKSRTVKLTVTIGVFLMYIVFCQSCMMMRTSPTKTKKYFAEVGISYKDLTAIIDEHPIHYIETGHPDKPTLFFVHGSPGSCNAFERYLTDTLLLQKYRMIAVDRPGYGYSKFGNPQDLLTQARWLNSLVKLKNNNKPILLAGHSMGGPLIVKMAVLKPNMYKQLLILSGSIDPDAENPEKWRAVIMRRPLRYLIPGAMKQSNDELWWLKTDLKEMKPELAKISSEVTIIHGTKDPLVPYSNVAFMEKEFVNARSITVIPIKDANHFIPWQHFEEIRNVLYNLQLKVED